METEITVHLSLLLILIPLLISCYKSCY